MIKSTVGQPRGILNLKAAEKKLQLALHSPSPDLSFFVEYYWIVSWDLRGQEPYLQENLPHPCVHLVFQKDKTAVFGVIKGKFSYLLENKGRVFGVKFRPGGFYPFVKTPISSFTDRAVSLRDMFGVADKALEEAILGRENESEMIGLVENFLCGRLPEQDETVTAVNQIIDCIIADRSITKVDQLVNRLTLNKRTLQRLFSQYVGVSPKWVINRYRIHEATEQLAKGQAVDWPRLALDLGYTDQAHFIKDFKTYVGQTPAEYARLST